MRKKIVITMLALSLALNTTPVMAKDIENMTLEELREEYLELEEKYEKKCDELEPFITGADADTVNKRTEEIFNKSGYSGDTFVDDLMKKFEEYSISYYEEDNVEFFSGTEIPIPDTIIKSMPECEDLGGGFWGYTFEDEEECRMYIKAYILYLASLGYDIEQKEEDTEIFFIDMIHAFGMATEDDGYEFVILGGNK